MYSAEERSARAAADAPEGASKYASERTARNASVRMKFLMASSFDANCPDFVASRDGASPIIRDWRRASSCVTPSGTNKAMRTRQTGTASSECERRVRLRFGAALLRRDLPREK